jgi:phosphoenolpyruvate carboxykinase (ATP)
MYSKTLIAKMKEHGAKAYLVNTGWNGTGKRISLKNTRAIIDAIISGEIDEMKTKRIPYLNLSIPTTLPKVLSEILDPRDTFKHKEEWVRKLRIWLHIISKILNNTQIQKKADLLLVLALH